MSPEGLSVGDWEYEDKVAVCMRACDDVTRVLVIISSVEEFSEKKVTFSVFRCPCYIL